ncbi:UDP-N-acetylmuramoyl-L-alanine--D-glutamate ligase, partial [Candidatus Pelagibacter sp.]|nr:UDP-N-acetylmuramoyl-L-alanine--D-glutamate ligase [Candidatus Pelagibacter sp.]
SDLDIFYSFYKNDSITVTGTNGKSTTCRLLYKILLDQKYDVKLVGNIGNPILSEKNIKKKTIFIIEASSYQLEYSKLFKSNYSAILNLSNDHIERHKTFKNYTAAKFKLLKHQSGENLAFVNKDDPIINKELKLNKFKCKIIKVSAKKIENFIGNLSNAYFLSAENKQNLSFVLEILKRFDVEKKLLIKTINNFRGLKYRQQIIYKTKYLTIINDSKSTSFSSSLGALQMNSVIYWLIGGINKKGDKLKLSKEYFDNISAFIFGKNQRFFNQVLKGKIKYENFKNLKDAFKKILKIISLKKNIHQTILFSPCAASFDNFKNFEDRGAYFNKLTKKYLNGNKKSNI